MANFANVDVLRIFGSSSYAAWARPLVPLVAMYALSCPCPLWVSAWLLAVRRLVPTPGSTSWFHLDVLLASLFHSPRPSTSPYPIPRSVPDVSRCLVAAIPLPLLVDREDRAVFRSFRRSMDEVLAIGSLERTCGRRNGRRRSRQDRRRGKGREGSTGKASRAVLHIAWRISRRCADRRRCQPERALETDQNTSLLKRTGS